ncbi:MAG TPA: VCBS repeat-containing protein [Anditalea sp.]|nr:VCBS repeat-containing protein [Anditalea sp.]
MDKNNEIYLCPEGLTIGRRNNLMNKILPIAILISLFSCSQPEEEEKLFTLLSAEETGIHFSNDLEATEELNILEYLYFYNGGGVAVGDVNNDGLVDIYFTSNQSSNKLYLNKGDFKFEDITDIAGVSGDGGWSTGVTMADVDGNGFLDIYVCQVGDYKSLSGSNKLYMNNGDGTFTEKAAEYGVDFVGFSTHALFFDYDNDGDLDLYLLNHSIKKPEVFSEAEARNLTQDAKGGDRLFKNLASEGTKAFEDVTQEAGIYSSSLGFGLGVSAADIDQDGWMDLYISNDFAEDDYLYLNNGDGTFREVLGESITQTSRYSMGNDINDINNDGFPDIFTTDMLPEDPAIWMKSVGEDKIEVYDVKTRFGYKDQYVRNHLQLNLGNGSFSEIALLTGTYATDWSWSPLIFDMDNSGYKDIHVTNGIYKRPNDLDFIQYSQTPSGLSANEIAEKQIEMLPTVKLANYAFRNLGELGFENASTDWGLDQLSYSNGSVYADLDNDGDLDLIINNINQPAFIYKNNSEKSGNHFLQIDLVQDVLNTVGVGAEVYVISDKGTLHQTLVNSRGFQSSVSNTLTFGLGTDPHIKDLIVIWPGGEAESFLAPDTNQRISLRKGSGKPSARPRTEENTKLTASLFPGEYRHQENSEYSDFSKEYLIPRKYSTEGPALAVGDVNGDGLEDIYFGGARNQPAELYLQQSDGMFAKHEVPDFEKLKMAEDVDAVFLDITNNGHLDLYVVSGGNEFAEGQLYNFDRVYINDGRGNFSFSPMALPPLGTNGKTVAAGDFNGDGYTDLFVGSNISHGQYGKTPESYLLLNNRRGGFIPATDQFAPELKHAGKINASQWYDITGNGALDLVVAGEWMPVQIYQNDGKGNLSLMDLPELDKEKGWWNSLSITGKGNTLQIIAGNHGLNSKLKASSEKPLTLYLKDFDGNNQLDPILFHHMGESHVPFASRDDLIKQIPSLKRKHGSYVEYAKLDQPSQLFNEKELEDAVKLEVTQFQSGVFNFTGIDFIFEPFPLVAQFSPIMDQVYLNESGTIFTVGNFYPYRTDIGKAAAKPFNLLKKDSNGMIHQITSLNQKEFWGEYRKIEAIIVGGTQKWLAVRNNDHPVLIEIKK